MSEIHQFPNEIKKKSIVVTLYRDAKCHHLIKKQQQTNVVIEMLWF